MMRRRAFLAFGASAAAAGAIEACARPQAPPAAPSTAPTAPTTAPCPTPSTSTPPPTAHRAPHADLEETTIVALSDRMARGETTARAVVEQYAARIDAIDRAGPSLRSVLEVNPDAIAIATALDEERRTKGARGPLHGIPVLVKDNVDTGDRMQTSCGSLALASSAAKDAGVVEKLRAAGAVVLGKTNLSEWANIRDERSTSGWSARGGLTKNPYCLDRNTSGSSSGSAAAIAASLAAVAIGTETDGSIVSPSSICGLVGLKPTVGLVSTEGIIPISHTQDTAGPMTRTVTDAAIVLGAIATGRGTTAVPDYAKSLDPNGARGLRIGALRGLPWSVRDVRATFDAALDALRGLGATVVDLKGLPRARDLDEPEIDVLLYELKANLASYLARRGDAKLRTLDDVVRFNATHTDELAWFGQDLFEKALGKGTLDDAAYKKALATCKRIAKTEGIDAALAKDKLDLLVAPTGGAAWVSDLVAGDRYTGSASSFPAVAGYPSLTVPSGATHGLPLGIMFFAGAYAEPVLLRAAFAYEQATKMRRPPAYAPTMPVGHA